MTARLFILLLVLTGSLVLTACSQSAPRAPANADLTTAPTLPTAALFRGRSGQNLNGI